MDDQSGTRDVPDHTDARTAAEAAPVPLLTCTPDTTITWRNAAARRLLGAVDRLADLVDGHDRAQLAAFVAGVAHHDRHAQLRVTTAAGLPVELLAQRAQPATVTVAVYDLSAFAAALDEARRSARTDPLTGLANRVAFADALDELRARGETGAIIAAIDLDQFKTVNDRYGHAAGDHVLVHVAATLAELAGPGETVARLGGDEFACCVPAGGLDRAAELARQLNDTLAEGCPLPDGTAVVVTASVGMATLDRLHDTAAALAEADVALYRAKAQGPGRSAVYRPADSDDPEVRRLGRTIEALRRRADVDARTGLLRDHVFDADLTVAVTEAHRSRRPLSLLLVDLDLFHDFNERYLYEAGHRALRAVAAATAGAVRDGDRCYRYGGEELAVILPDTVPEAAAAVAERIRAAVAALAIPHAGGPAGVVTVSVGVSTLVGDGTGTGSWLVNGANVAVDAAKDAGRDTVRHAAPTAIAPPLRARR